MKNKWICPVLVNLDLVKASDMVVENPRRRFDTTRTEAVGKSAAVRRLFSTEHSSLSHSVAQLTLDDVTSSMYPECPNAVAFWYAFAEHELQYWPYADVNVGHSNVCETALHCCCWFSCIWETVCLCQHVCHAAVQHAGTETGCRADQTVSCDTWPGMVVFLPLLRMTYLFVLEN